MYLIQRRVCFNHLVSNTYKWIFFFLTSSTDWVMWTFSVRSKERDGMKRRQNLTNVVHFLSWMKHITKASETEFSSEMLIADNHLQSCLHPAWFWKIVINDQKLEGGSVGSGVSENYSPSVYKSNEARVDLFAELS